MPKPQQIKQAIEALKLGTRRQIVEMSDSPQQGNRRAAWAERLIDLGASVATGDFSEVPEAWIKEAKEASGSGRL